MKEGLDILVRIFLVILLIFCIGVLAQATIPTHEPGDHNVNRLVDTQYGVLCYYQPFAISCSPLPDSARGK